MSLDDLQTAVGLWHCGAFPREHDLELALGSSEEIGELIEALDESKALQILSTRLTRAFLKESHGANDRRADTDWTAEIYDEIGDVLIVLATIAERRGWSLEQALRSRFAYVSARFPTAVSDA